MSKESLAFVRYSLSINAIELFRAGEERELKSKRRSPYFFNSGKFDTGESMAALARAYAAIVPALPGEVIFGPAYKGIPIAATVAVAMHQIYGRNLGYSFNRKEEKDHGEKGGMVGASMKGRRVIYVDDVMTTSGTAEESLPLIEAAGGKLVGCIIAFDRQEHGTKDVWSATEEFSHFHKVPVMAAATLDDLIEVLTFEDSDCAQESLPLILAYQEKYGNRIGR